MGDRGNVCIRETTDNVENDVYLYTHWSGAELPEIVRVALAKRWRWNDAPYLTRIIFNELQGDDRGETGFGISPTIGDNQYDIVVVDVEAQTVAFVPVDRFKTKRVPAAYAAERIPFTQFIAGKSR